MSNGSAEYWNVLASIPTNRRGKDRLERIGVVFKNEGGTSLSGVITTLPAGIPPEGFRILIAKPLDRQQRREQDNGAQPPDYGQEPPPSDDDFPFDQGAQAP